MQKCKCKSANAKAQMQKRKCKSAKFKAKNERKVLARRVPPRSAKAQAQRLKISAFPALLLSKSFKPIGIQLENTSVF
jgi:hypothetical protein